MKKKIVKGLIAAVITTSTLFGGLNAGFRDVDASMSAAVSTVTLTRTVYVYFSSTDAKNQANPAKTYPAGTYYVYSSYNGMVNITKIAGQPGGWYNPYSTKFPTAPPTTTVPTTTTPATKPPTTTVPSPSITPTVDGKYQVLTTIPKYLTADNARNGISPVGNFTPGIYYIYKIYNGIICLTSTPGVPGHWISPNANGKVISSGIPYQDFRPMISAANMGNIISYISVNYPSRAVGRQITYNCGLYIKRLMEGYGYSVTLQTFPSWSLYGVSSIDYDATVYGKNVIAKLPNYNPAKKNVIFVCHLDSVLGTPGANDNASGIAMMVEMARIIKANNLALNYNPVFLFADGEEVGKVGSGYWIGSQTSTFRANTALVVDVDMVGKGDHYQLWNTTSYYKSLKYPQMAFKIGNQMGLSMEFRLHERGLSDYREFENRGIQSVCIMNLYDKYGNKEGTYHTAYDKANLISSQTLLNVGNIILNLVKDIR